MNKYMEK